MMRFLICAFALGFVPAAQAQVLPNEFIGVWGHSNLCELKQKGEFPFIIVSKTGYEGHEVSCKATRIVGAAGAEVKRVTFACEGEGEKWNSTETWRIIKRKLDSVMGITLVESKLSIDGVLYKKCAFEVAK